jgi:hypothetical protein
MARRPRVAPELVEIAPAGALAGRVFAAVLIGSGVVLAVAAWEDLWRRCGAIEGRCAERAAAAGLLTIVAALAVVGGVATWIRVGRRPQDPEGSSRYAWALGAVFAIGMILVAARIPGFTCERGRFDEALELCMHPPSTSEPARWLLVKQAIVALGLLGGLAIALTPRLVRIWVWVAVAAWIAGAGRVVLDTLVRA